MDLGNHEFNFGSDDLQGGHRARPTFPILGANVTDTGAYGLAAANGGVGVKPYVEKTVGEASRSRSWGSRTTASRTTSCRATSRA